jgi:hypothetical protein
MPPTPWQTEMLAPPDLGRSGVARGDETASPAARHHQSNRCGLSAVDSRFRAGLSGEPKPVVGMLYCAIASSPK